MYLKDMMSKIEKGLDENSSLFDAIHFMKELKWNTIPVINEKHRLVGVFTRSTLFKMILERQSLDTPIISYIKRDVISLPLDTPYEKLEKIVKESTVGTGVVVDHDQEVIGLFSKTDMISALFRSSQSLKEQLETVLDSSELGVFLTDHTHKIIFINDKLITMLNTTKEKIIGKYIDVIFSFKKDSNHQYVTPQRMHLKQYELVVKIATYNTVKGNTGYIAIFQNISEIKEMAEELNTVKKLKRLLDSVIENAYDGIITFDENGLITFSSPSMLDLFSLEKDKALRKPIDSIFPQLHLTKVLKTGIADVSDMLEINGISYIVHRIPVVEDGEIIGGIGKVMYRQLHEVRDIFKRLDMMENKINYYQQELKKTETSRFTMDHIYTRDAQMEKLKRTTMKAAKGRSTILVRGESGTGKELFAHAIHSVSARKNGPFVTVNCAAIPDHLLESEFFGYEEGAFTGAKQKGKLGKFDLANGGTLFLDEIGDMSIQLQAKLLRVLQEKEFYRVGGMKRIRVDVRIISATNRLLEEMVKKGLFREDLYYRLNVISIEIPPLRKRSSDILLLSNLFIKEMNKVIGTSVTGMENEVERALLEYQWPGNVRELKNIMERGVTFSEHGKIKLEDLPDYMRNNSDIGEASVHHQKNLLKKAEEEMIREALAQTNGNKSEAAKVLGISRSVLYTKLKKYNM